MENRVLLGCFPSSKFTTYLSNVCSFTKAQLLILGQPRAIARREDAARGVMTVIAPKQNLSVRSQDSVRL